MALPSPAADYAESRIFLYRQLISHPAATYFMQAMETHLRAGIVKGVLLVIDNPVIACDGSIIVCAIEGDFHL